MATQSVCPNCLRLRPDPADPGRPTCPHCDGGLAMIGPDLGESHPGSSALDEPISRRPVSSGSITMLRQGLRNDEGNSNGGWLENILTRRVKAPTPAPDASTPARPPRQDPRAGIATDPGSAEADHRFDAPGPREVPHRPAPGLREEIDGPPGSRRIGPGDRAGHRVGRIPLGGVAALLVVGAIAAVAPLRGRETWADLLLLVTVSLLGVSILGILHRHHDRKAFWQGFALFGWGYLALAFVPSILHGAGAELPSSRWLGDLHARVTAGAEGPRIPSTASARIAAPDPSPQQVAWVPVVAGDLRQFRLVGHCLSALAAALVGSAIARGFSRSDPGPI